MRFQGRVAATRVPRARLHPPSGRRPVESSSEALGFMGPSIAQDRPHSPRNRSSETVGIAHSSRDAAGQSTPNDASSGRQIILPLLLTVQTLCLVYSIAQQTPPPSLPQRALAAPARSIYRTSAMQLYHDYNANEAATQAQIGAQRIRDGSGAGRQQGLPRRGAGAARRGQPRQRSGNEFDRRSGRTRPAIAARTNSGVLCDQIQRFTEAPSGSGCTLVDSPLESQNSSVVTQSNSIPSIPAR